MNVLITGANGFLGLQVVKKVLDLTDGRVRCFMRSAKNEDKIQALKDQNPGRVEIQRGSLLNDQDCCQALVDVDMVYHLAAAKGGAAAEMFLNSSVATDHLFKAIVNAGRQIKVVFCSSFSVYGTAHLPAGAMVDEFSPLEKKPYKRDVYAMTKFYQEKLVRRYYDDHNIPVVILRPGVIYGPGSTGISGRVGLNLFGLFFHLGANNLLPLTYVDNCAEAFVVAAEKSDFSLDMYNVVDDDLVTSRQFLRLYKKNVRKFRTVHVNFHLVKLVSWLCERYHEFSRGQLPDIFTPYKTASIWVGRRYTNKKLKAIGWCPRVSMVEGLQRYFADIKERG